MRGSGASRYPVLAIAIASLAFWSLVLFHTGGTLVDGVAPGDRSMLSPISHLGTTAALTGCTTAPTKVGSATRAFCGDWDAIVAKDGTVEVVSLHAPAASTVVAGFRGSLPLGLGWGDTIKGVEQALGKPDRITSIYGTPTLVYMFRDKPFGSLELRFSAGDRLVGINACLER